ncbi:hypothetical protein [Sphaerisporangium sp. TRM90804]|uniref:hypothetical protein n=1 Tax=Sphaerisporangium sp. TRM90804 TaxID=3031113 RepID=UPI00244CF402|nr:hypothetical protein [Sphaerisporangium sp. TRM90804]MDH2428245.1 hypothetical protein [Sphaerisporangium sp. TRM90804]
MPALATRFNGGTAEPPASGQAPPHQVIGARLSGEFLSVPVETVHRCVEDVRACAAHLGVDVPADAVERIARERLLAVATSAPLLTPSPHAAPGHGRP